VFQVGSPDIEFASLVKRVPDAVMKERLGGVGADIDFARPFILVIQHPVTSETSNHENVLQTLEAVHGLGVQALWFWPNPDAGTDEISKGIRQFREQNKNSQIRFVIDLHPRDFLSLLKHSACLVGNSSSGIKEASFFGVPVVNIGTRQHGRTRGENVTDVGYAAAEIRSAMERQMKQGRYAPSRIYSKPDTAQQIVEVLKTVPLYTQKQFHDSTA
jgi:UDP-hydrolysing UDP-N-acetyl-D-glucosamine 2-epimerase